MPEYFHKFSNAVIRRFYKLYFLHILPAIGGAVSGNKSAYKYLPASVLNFPGPDKFISMMKEAHLASSQKVLTSSKQRPARPLK